MYTYIIHNIFWWKYHNITIKVLIIMILIDSNLLQFSFGFVLLHTRNYELIYIVYLYESPKTKTRNKYYSDTYYCILLFVIDISTLLKWKKLSAYKASCLPLIFLQILRTEARLCIIYYTAMLFSNRSFVLPLPQIAIKPVEETWMMQRMCAYRRSNCQLKDLKIRKC